MNYKLLQGDCLEKLKLLPDNSVDSVVTDPPAGISFMGKTWDDDKGGRKEWINWLSSIFVEVKRVLKPGGHCLVWSIPRTSHWTGTALEDAGFEVRDVLNHVYGSGFPKSLNIGKAVDKKLGNEREVIGNRKLLGTAIHDGGTRPDGADTIDLTKGSSEWEGWGTGLKPAVECWWLVRKPISEKTIVDNVLRWGTGGLNIDECRIGYVNDSDKESMVRPTTENNPTEYTTNHCKKILQDDKYNLGRFPANFIHDGSDEVMKEFEKAGVSKSTIGKVRKATDEKIKEAKFAGGTVSCEYQDTGTPARFFYCSKPSTKERNMGCDELEEKGCELNRQQNSGTLEERYNLKSKNNHPTIKSVKLMAYLITLITPKNGIVLDPFMGSGTTGISALLLDHKFIGIEMNADYIKIAETRIKAFEKYRQFLK